MTANKPKINKLIKLAINNVITGKIILKTITEEIKKNIKKYSNKVIKFIIDKFKIEFILNQLNIILVPSKLQETKIELKTRIIKAPT